MSPPVNAKITDNHPDALDAIYKTLQTWGTSRDDGTDGDAARPATGQAQANHRAEPEPAAATVVVP